MKAGVSDDKDLTVSGYLMIYVAFMLLTHIGFLLMAVKDDKSLPSS